MQEVYAINPLTPEVRDIMTGALKWIRRIEDRKDTLPPLFMDNTDITPLREAMEDVLDGRMTKASGAILEQVFIESGAVPRQ